MGFWTRFSNQLILKILDEEIFETIWTNKEEHTEVRELDKEYNELLEALGSPTREEAD